MNIAVIGGSKGVGSALVHQALSAGHHVRVLARSAMNIPAQERLQWLCGDAAKPNDLQRVIDGVDAIAVCLGGHFAKGTTLYSDTVKTLISACTDRPHRPYLVVLSGIGAGESKGHGGFIYDYLVHPLILRHDYADKNRMEATLQASDYPYCIVRPGFLTDQSSDDYRVIETLSDADKAAKISRRAVANFMLSELSQCQYQGKVVHCWQ